MLNALFMGKTLLLISIGNRLVSDCCSCLRVYIAGFLDFDFSSKFRWAEILPGRFEIIFERKSTSGKEKSLVKSARLSLLACSFERSASVGECKSGLDIKGIRS